MLLSEAVENMTRQCYYATCIATYIYYCLNYVAMLCITRILIFHLYESFIMQLLYLCALVYSQYLVCDYSYTHASMHACSYIAMQTDRQTHSGSELL